VGTSPGNVASRRRRSVDELIARALSGEASELERRKLDRWREASPGNERVYRDARAAWTAVRRPGAEAVGAPPEPADLMREARERRRRTEARAARRAILGSPWTGYGVAAAAAVAVLVVSLRSGERATPEASLSPLESSTGSGQVTTMALSDGSVVRTAPSTRVEFPPARGRREVNLEGKAFFAVAAAAEPFVVRTGLGELTVLGTRFEVVAAPRNLRLVVVEGVVHLVGAGGVADVRQGQVAYLSEDTAPRVLDRTDPWSLLDWGDGLLVFQATPLRDVAGQIERHFGRDVHVADPLAERRVTAWFQDESLEEVAAAVCLIVAARCRVSDTTVQIGSP
jgi:transmembrane sensor